MFQIFVRDNTDKNLFVCNLTLPEANQKWISVKLRYREQVWLESAMVGESCLLEKAGSKRHANYTLESSFLDTSCSCFKI